MCKYSTFVGLDLGDKESHFCVMDENGTIVERGAVATSRGGLRRKFARMEPGLVALEVGTHSLWISRLLKEYGHKVLVANASRVALIYGKRRKRDRVDAETLARLVRLDPQLLYPVEHRGKQAQADMAVVRSRDALIKARTQLVNHVRGSMKAMGHRAASCSTRCFHKKVVAHLPEELKNALGGVIALIGQLTEQIAVYDKQLEEIARKRYPETVLLEQVGGVGRLTSLCFVLTLEDPYRFTKSRRVGPYVGLVPKQDQSGDSDPQLRITKEGSRMLRRLLVGSAHYILGPFGPDSDLRRWGLAIAERGGKNAKRRAVVAVARKLSVLLHRLWVSGEAYEPIGYNDGQPPAMATTSDEQHESPFSEATMASSVCA